MRTATKWRAPTAAEIAALDEESWRRTEAEQARRRDENEAARRTWEDPRQVAAAEAAMKRALPNWGRRSCG